MSLMDDKELHRKLLDCIYPVPDGVMENGARYFHADLEEMSEVTLRCEFERVKDRMKYEPQPSGWLLRRHDLVKGRLNE